MARDLPNPCLQVYQWVLLTLVDQKHIDVHNFLVFTRDILKPFLVSGMNCPFLQMKDHHFLDRPMLGPTHSSPSFQPSRKLHLRQISPIHKVAYQNFSWWLTHHILAVYINQNSSCLGESLHCFKLSGCNALHFGW